MSRTITIDPVTRIEGHAKVTVRLNDAGAVELARFHVNEFRGFEKFCEGRLFHELPQITQRICGICPVSHHLVSVKACDQILGVDPPKPAKLLRELAHMGQVIQSHGMHFFMLGGPDLILGFDADPAIRNVAGIAAANPALAGKAIALRKFGQDIIARVGDRRIHPTLAVPGGVCKALSAADRDAIRAQIPDMITTFQAGLAVMRQWATDHAKEMSTFAVFDTGYLGMVRPDDNTINLYDGRMRMIDSDGREIVRFDGRKYLDYIAEHVESWSYLKFPFYRPAGFPDGVYRVGPLGRLNVAEHMGTPLAEKAFEEFRALADGKPVSGSLYYHWARLVEGLYAVERAAQLLDDPEITSQDIRATGKVKNHEGVGVLEAPRGTLWHHYWVDDNGVIQKLNLIVATGNNNYAMSRGVEEVAKQYVKGPNVSEGALNRIEAAIRAYDPCLSCSTHALGQMPLQLEIQDPQGRTLSTQTR
jgi:NAD-reducing hydrogenase large subunit